MIEESMKSRIVSRVVADGTYDSIRLYSYFERMDIEPIIRPCKNSRTDRGPPSRRSAARMIRDLGIRDMTQNRRLWREMIG